jgi:uncharacterized protein (UPF0333 family)
MLFSHADGRLISAKTSSTVDLIQVDIPNIQGVILDLNASTANIDNITVTCKIFILI